MIRAESVFFRAGRAELLSDLSLSVPPGQMTVIVGPNGAGKSTLLRLLAGDRPPAAGRIIFEGRPLAAWDPVALARRRAVLSQSVTVDFPMTAAEIAAFGRIPHRGRTDRRHDERIIARALELADATALADRSYATLSGGEQQRVQFARALAQILDGVLEGLEPAFLLLDEPTASLDIAHQAQLLRAARALADDGTGVLVVLHDLNLAATYADTIAVMARGRLVACGSPAAVLTPETVQSVYGWPVTCVQPPGAARPVLIPAA